MVDSKKSKKDEFPFHYGLVLKIFPSTKQKNIILENINGARFYYNFLVEQDIKLHKIGKEPNIFVDLIQSRRNQILEETYGKKIIKAVTAKDGTVKQKTSYIGKLDYVKNTFPWLRSSSLDAQIQYY